MGSGALRFRLCTHSDMKQILVTLLLLGALLAVTEGKRRGGKPKKARSGRGGERSWHIAVEEGETSCGISTEIFTTETPSSLCTEAGSNFCICATRGDLKDEEEVRWKYTCGSCDLKWKPERDEEAAKKRKQEKKKISAEAKARKKEMRRKMRQKLKGREGRQEKMKRRKQSHRAAMTESQNEEE